MGKTVDKLNYLLGTKEAIRDAIENKGVEVLDSDTFRSYADKIEAIEAGGGEEINNQKKTTIINENGVTIITPEPEYTGLSELTVVTNVVDEMGLANFYDYDGSLVYSFTVEEINSMSEMPALPSHSGLVSRGWNWSLDGVKRMMTNYGRCDVGAMYATDDGTTRLYVEDAQDGLPFSVTIYTLYNTPSPTIDWGDGTTTSLSSGTGSVTTSHEYNTSGNYVISISYTEGLCGIACRGEIYRIEFCDWSYPLNEIHFSKSNVREITIGPSSSTSFSSKAWGSTTSISCLIIPSGITSIKNRQDDSTDDGSGLKRVIFPEGLVTIGRKAFWYSLIDSVVIPDTVSTIDSYAFSSCELYNVIIPEGVTTINAYAFSSNNLKSIVLPNSLEYLNLSSFNGNNIDSLIVGNKVVLDENPAISGNFKFIELPSESECGEITLVTPFLTSFSVPYGATGIKITNTTVSTEYYEVTYCALREITIPETVTSVNLSKCVQLTKITLPDYLTYLRLPYSRIRRIVIPEGITTLGDAFDSCDLLRVVTLPSTVTSITQSCFSGVTLDLLDCTRLSSIPSFTGALSTKRLIVQSGVAYNWLLSAFSNAYKAEPEIEVSSCSNLSIISAQNVSGNATNTQVVFSAIVSGISKVTGENMVDVPLLFVGTSDLFSINTSDVSIERDISFTYFGQTASYTITQGPYINNCVRCVFSPITTTSNTTLVYSSFSNFTSYFDTMYVDGAEVTLSKTYTFDSTLKHEVVFKVKDGANVSNLYRMFQEVVRLSEVDLSELDMSLVTSTSSSGGSARMFSGCSLLQTVVLPNNIKHIGSYMFTNCYAVTKFTVLASTAPSVANYAFGSTADDAMGKNNRDIGKNLFFVPPYSNGYDSGNWVSRLLSPAYCGFTRMDAYSIVEVTELNITADDVDGNKTSTTVHLNAVANVYFTDGGRYVEGLAITSEATAEIPQNTSSSAVTREVSFTFYGVTATTTITHGPYKDYRIVCKYNVTSTTSSTALLYTKFAWLDYMIVEGQQVDVATSYTFSTRGEQEVIFKVNDEADITSIYQMFYSRTSLLEVDFCETDLSKVTSTSNSSGTAYLFYGCINLRSVVFPDSLKYMGYYMFYNCKLMASLTIPLVEAPSIYGNYTFGGSSASYSMGYTNRAAGTNILRIPAGATGYDTGAWTARVLSTSYCGFTIEEY